MFTAIPLSCLPHVQPSRLNHSLVHHMKHKYISKLRSYTLLLVSHALWYYSIVTHRKCIAKHMINQRISADWCTTSEMSSGPLPPSTESFVIENATLGATYTITVSAFNQLGSNHCNQSITIECMSVYQTPVDRSSVTDTPHFPSNGKLSLLKSSKYTNTHTHTHTHTHIDKCTCTCTCTYKYNLYKYLLRPPSSSS